MAPFLSSASPAFDGELACLNWAACIRAMDAGKHEAPSLAAAAREERSFCIGCPGGELAEQWHLFGAPERPGFHREQQTRDVDFGLFRACSYVREAGLYASAIEFVDSSGDWVHRQVQAIPVTQHIPEC